MAGHQMVLLLLVHPSLEASFVSRPWTTRLEYLLYDFIIMTENMNEVQIPNLSFIIRFSAGNLSEKGPMILKSMLCKAIVNSNRFVLTHRCPDRTGYQKTQNWTNTWIDSKYYWAEGLTQEEEVLCH